MLKEIFLAVIQAATEFLPISSSGHLALASNLISEPNLFFFVALHLASLLAVLIFVRKEIYAILSFNKKYKNLWLYLFVATIPAALFGYLFKRIIEPLFSSLLSLGLLFILNGFILLSTKFIKLKNSSLSWSNSAIIGLSQCLALLPGISRSGITVSSGLFVGINKETAVKFSFLLFIPLSIGALILESASFYINASLILAFISCLIFSLIFLNFFMHIVKRNKLWAFSIYCFASGLISLILHFYKL